MSCVSTTAIDADPFREHRVPPATLRYRVLGSVFEFEAEDAVLARLVEHAYAGLPAHRLSANGAHLKLGLTVATSARARAGERVPRVETLSGAGLLCGSTARSTFAAISPGGRSALIVVSREMLRHAYHVRYELIEFAVFTLAARAQRLMPLHAACLGRHGRGALIMGDSGAGKSTAALHGALRGLELVSEDSVFVESASLLATGVPNFLHVRRESLRFLPASLAAQLRCFPTIRRRSGVAKLEIDLRRTQWPLSPRAVRIETMIFAVPRAVERGESLLVPLDPDEALARLAAAQPYAAQCTEWPLFTRRLAAVPAFELRRGKHPQEAAAALESLLPAEPSAGAKDSSARAASARA